VANEQLYLLWQVLHEADQTFRLGHFGLYATESMRLEKGYLHWKTDLSYEYNPFETGLERFVNLDKKDFVGKQALLEQVDRGPRKQRVTLTIECATAPAHIGDPVFFAGRQRGSLTSAGYGHRVDKNIAYAYVDPGHATIGSTAQIGILGERYPATIVDPVLYDPANTLVKA